MSSATKNAAILLAHYRRVGLAVAATGLTDPTFRRALRGGTLRRGSIVALDHAVKALQLDREIRTRQAKAPHDSEDRTPLRALQAPLDREVTLSELLSFREQLLDFASRIHGSTQVAA